MIEMSKRENYFGPETTISQLKLEIMDAVWKELGIELHDKLKTSESPFDQQRYYEFNRKVSDTLNKFIQVFKVQKRLPSYDYNERPQDMQEYVEHEFSAMIAKEIFKSKVVAITKFEAKYEGYVEFNCSIPFMAVQNKPKVINPHHGAGEEG